jgi:hypothetical protein
MNYYRLLVWETWEEDKIEWHGVTVTREPQFFKTAAELDLVKLFDQGIAAKQYESLPDNVKVKKLPEAG